MADWLSTDEAATYLGIGKTKLYALTKEGKVPANRVGKKWTYERQALTEWLRASKSPANFFVDTPAQIEDNMNLRDPQRDAYARAADFFQRGGKTALIQLPVGCGKSGLAAI